MKSFLPVCEPLLAGNELKYVTDAVSSGWISSAGSYVSAFEKAFADIQGSYPTIAREMARMVRERHPEVKWLNREDDLGLEGLRKAKLSYYPEILLEKYTVREQSHG